MKKTLALSIVLLAALACNKEVAVTTPVTEEHPLVPMTFTAEIDNLSKAVMDGLKTNWAVGDQISVSKSLKSQVTDAPVLTSTKAGAVTTFTGTAPSGLTTHFACYPASSVINWNNAATETGINAVTFLLKPTQQAYKFATIGGVDQYIDPAVLCLVGQAGTDLNFKFQHAFAYIKFTVPKDNPSKYKTITINNGNATDGSSPTSNTCNKVNINGDRDWAVGFTSGGKNLAIKYGDPATTLPAGTFYIAIAPKKYDKLTFNFMNNVGKHIFKCKDGGEAGITLNAGTIYDIGTLPEMTFPK